MNNRILALPLLAGALALTGCQSMPSTIQDNPNTASGAAIGAVGGAVLGSAVAGKGRKTEGALLGAVIGGLAGGAIGNYMDEQERALRQQTAGSGIDVSRQGENIVLSFPDQISFDVGRAEIKPQFTRTLDNVAQTLRQYDRTRIEIAGHTDSTGNAASNQALSENRAKAVRSYLASRGVALERMYAVGYGSSRPIASNATAEGRAQNRRVEIIVIPNQ
ncbi:MAG: OmpA family protein [Gammaproteobacteria bacterium]|nr:OmpA family protein [Gammaproteobacteria bacterium]